MNSAPLTSETVRQHTESLLKSIGISRIVVVDDEYSEDRPEVEELLGICAELKPRQAAKLPYLDHIDFETDREIWADQVRERWQDLGETKRREVLERVHSLDKEGTQEALGDGASECKVAPNGLAEPDVPKPEGGGSRELDTPADIVDTRAAKSLNEILGGMQQCEFMTLSLKEWKTRSDKLLAKEAAASTVFLFDRDFRREQDDAENEGLKLVREVQGKEAGYCGLISHTIPVGGEFEAWLQLADKHNLMRDNFVVIAKNRLTDDTCDHYSFLRMLRLVALNERCARVKSIAWSVFEESVTAAKDAVERLSVLDFDRIVLASSRREGVWEPDTLFRVFGILMRREAQRGLYQDSEIMPAVAEARRISAIPDEVADALGEEKPSREALRIQRFEIYDADETLNRFCLPLELGDIFETSTGRQFILLAQPCDLMVRKNGKRNYDEKYGRTGALAELIVDQATSGAKESRQEVPFYNADTGTPAYADFARVHQVRLAVLDLCVLQEDGVAKIKTDGACPQRLIEPWKKRYARLQSFFATALGRYTELGRKQVTDELKLLALPVPSATIRLPVTVSGRTVQYDLKRVIRVRQPWSGVLLSALSQYQARAAFEHPFDHILPMEGEENGRSGQQEQVR